MEYLLTRIPADGIYYPATEELHLEHSAVYPVSQDLQILFGAAAITVVAPIYVEDANENSLCVLFDSKNCDILITGDRTAFGERMLMRYRELPDVDILVAGHHGSHNATSLELLLATQPDAAAISVGENNRYGHPRAEVLDRLSRFGCNIYRTDKMGTITFRR